MSEPLPGAEIPPPSPLGSPAVTKSTTWPDVIGIIAIILGALGILSEIGNVFYPFIQPMMNRVLSRTMPPGAFEAFLGFMPPGLIIMFSGLVKLILAVVMLIGGIHLKNRRKLGVKILKVWSIIAIPWAVLEMGFAGIVVRSMFPHLPRVVEWGPRTDLFVQGGMMAGLLIMLSVPVFLLAWFGSRSVSTEVAGWDD